MTTTATSQTPPTPALTSLRALLALLTRLIFQPGASGQTDQLFARAEALLARHILEGALRLSGRTDLRAEDFDARLIWRGGLFKLDVRRKPQALHPLHRILINNLRANRIARIRVALARRHRFSRKFHNIIARANARRAAVRAARHAAHRRFSSHTPARVSAPP